MSVTVVYAYEGVREMNAAAKEKLFEIYITENLDSAYRFAYTYMKNRHDAEDVVSESVVRALDAISTLRNPQYIKVWFYRIIANTALTALKKQSRYVSVDFTENAVEAEPGQDDYSDLYLNDILQELPEKYRAPVIMKICEGMTLAEIAKVLGINENTAKTRLYTAFGILRKKKEELV